MNHALLEGLENPRRAQRAVSKGRPMQSCQVTGRCPLISGLLLRLRSVRADNFCSETILISWC
jgi:hypothetical protein